MLRRVPAVYVTDLFVRPDLHTGRIAVTITVRNSQDAAVPGQADSERCPDQAGEIISSSNRRWSFPPDVEHELTMQVAQPRPGIWKTLISTASPGRSPSREAPPISTRFVAAFGSCGWSMVFHTQRPAHLPQDAHTGRGLRRDMLNAKAAGFNMVRFIAGVADPAQLDFCDGLGLMVYEECLASWLPGRFAQDGRTFRSQHRRHDPPGPQPSLRHHLGATERDRERPGVPAGGRLPAQAAPARPHPPGVALQWALGRRPLYRLGEQPGR